MINAPHASLSRIFETPKDGSPRQGGMALMGSSQPSNDHRYLDPYPIRDLGALTPGAGVFPNSMQTGDGNDAACNLISLLAWDGIDAKRRPAPVLDPGAGLFLILAKATGFPELELLMRILDWIRTVTEIHHDAPRHHHDQ